MADEGLRNAIYAAERHASAVTCYVPSSVPHQVRGILSSSRVIIHHSTL
jgi:ribosomal protein S5